MKTEFDDAQKGKEETWFTYPTKRNILIIVAVWVVSTVLLTLAVTDLFTDSFFKKGHIMIYIMMITSTLITLRAVLNYLKNKKITNPGSEKTSE